MDKKEPKHLKEEHSHPKKEATCNCGPDCKCGCQEGGECHCGENGCCHCGCGCGCGCKKRAAKLLAALLIFALGFFTAKVFGCKPCMRSFPCPKTGFHAPMPHAPEMTDGNGNTIIIINTDGSADVSRFLGHKHGKNGCDCHHDKHQKAEKHHKHHLKMKNHDSEAPVPAETAPTAAE